MPNFHSVLAYAVVICSLTTSVVNAQQERPTIPGALSAAIRKLTPGAALVGAEEVDPIACKPVGDSPGLVKADLNGDGREDYAALLKVGETGKETSWEGKTLHEVRFSLVLFLDNGHGGYEPRVVRHYTDFIPTGVVLDLQPAGSVRDRDTHQNIKLRNPAVTLSFCEKSAVTYFLAGGKIRSIAIAD